MTVPFIPSQFNPDDRQESEFNALPSGVYRVVSTSVEKKDSKANPDNKYFDLCFECVDEPHAGRLVWHKMNLENTNQMAVNIAKRQLTQLLRVMKKPSFQQWEELLDDHPLAVQVYTEEYNGREQNKVKWFRPAIGAPKTPPRQPAPAGTGSATPTGQAAGGMGINKDDLPF